jgi:hypothetical protein
MSCMISPGMIVDGLAAQRIDAAHIVIGERIPCLAQALSLVRGGPLAADVEPTAGSIVGADRVVAPIAGAMAWVCRVSPHEPKGLVARVWEGPPLDLAHAIPSRHAELSSKVTVALENRRAPRFVSASELGLKKPQ